MTPHLWQVCSYHSFYKIHLMWHTIMKCGKKERHFSIYTNALNYKEVCKSSI